jgi:hypothetical protein
MTRHWYKARICATRAGSLVVVHDHDPQIVRVQISSNAVSGPRVKEFRINSLTPMTPEPEAESCPLREWLRSCELHGGSFIDPCGLGALMPGEETESPEEVRSQRRRSLPNVDE